MSLLSSANSSLFNESSLNNGSQSTPQSVPGYSSPWLISVLGIFCFLSVTENSLVFYLLYKKKPLRTLSNFFLVSLAASDLVSGLLGISLCIACFVKETIPLCVSSALSIRFTAFSSVCHLLLIAGDRYAMIVHPMKHRLLLTKPRAIGALMFIWLFSIPASVIQLSWYSLDEASLSEIEERTQRIDIGYILACIVIFFALPLFLMCYIYGRIVYISVQHIKGDRYLNGSVQRQPRSIWWGSGILFLMMFIFTACWLPYFLDMLLSHIESLWFHIPVWAGKLMIILCFLPPLLNPILCTLCKPDFRDALIEVIRGKRMPYHAGTVRFNNVTHEQTTQLNLQIHSNADTVMIV